MQNLNATELKKLIQTVFPYLPGDERLAILVDVPDEKVPDHQKWLLRRQIAKSWAQELQLVVDELNLKAVNLFFYPNVHSNNADLPEFAFAGENISPEMNAEKLVENTKISFTKIFETHQLYLAPTEFSTTAPLKLMAKKYNFRAATMPGFTPEMIPAMRLDYDVISERVNLLKTLVDTADGALIFFMVDQKDFYKLYLDLRFRTGHSSTGLFPERGLAGNLPSGECYIVPYEGEKEKIISQSAGFLPVQFEDEVVIYQIQQNRAVVIISDGPFSQKEVEKIKAEPAYANLAELGLGVLSDFGVQPIGQILLDEKLGLHIAFGRSDHFGGAVGVKDFSSPEAVEHTDRIYLPSLQNRIQVDRVELIMANGKGKTIMERDEWVVFGAQSAERIEHSA